MNIIAAISVTTRWLSTNRDVWKKDEFDTSAILCGICNNEMTIREYLTSNNRCPHCNSAFNPNCSKHYHLYFEL